MRAFVFTDRALAGQAGRFVWLEIDTEKARNAAIRKRLNIPALPSFFVVDPADGRVALRWTGGASVAQLLRILDDGAAAVAVRSSGAPADVAVARADSAYAAGDFPTAASAYGRALSAGRRDPRVVESLLFSLQSIDSCEAVIRVVEGQWMLLAHSPSAANLAASALGCALALPAEHPGRAALIGRFERDARAVLADTTLALAVDDRSAVYGTLVDLAEDRKDSLGAIRAAEAWARYLDAEAARAPTADARGVFDSHRLSAWIAAGHPERAVAFLQASERDQPDDYNPPARLAIAYRALKRWDDGLAASDRALAKAYGPRRLGMFQVRADLYAGKGDEAARRRTIEQAIAEAEAFPPGQRSEGTIASLKKKLEPPKP